MDDRSAASLSTDVAVGRPGFTDVFDDSPVGDNRGLSEFTPSAVRGLIASVVAQFFGGTAAIGLFPLLMLPVSTHLGWSLTVMGAMAGVSALMAAIGMPVWGVLVDRYGARGMLLIGLVATSACFFLLAVQSGNLAQGFASYALTGFCGALSVVHIKAQSARFDRQRGVVLAILAVAIGLSFGAVPLIAKPLLDAEGWRVVYAAFGVPPLLISFPLAFAWFRGMPAASRGIARGMRRGGVTLGQALKCYSFWIVALFCGCSAFVFIGLQAHAVAFLQGRGFSSQRAVEILSLAVAGTLTCQLISGWLLDRLRTPRVALIFVGAQMAGVVLLLTTSGGMGTVFGILLLNSGSGGELSMLPYMLSRTFGLGELARIYGLAACLSQLLGGISPVVLGAIHDRTGTYGPALPLFGGVLIVGCGLILLMPRFPVSARTLVHGS